MLEAFLWCLLSSLSLVVGGLLGLSFSFGRRTLGCIMGFGAGALLSAVSFELVLKAIKLSFGTGATAPRHTRQTPFTRATLAIAIGQSNDCF